MKRVLLTGATGFVGANLARRLLHDGHEVHLLVRQGYAPWRIADIQADVHLHPVDLGDSAAAQTAVTSIRPDWIFHMAAHGAYSSQTDIHQIIQTNLTATANLVEACLKTGFESFIHTGSSSEYGFKDYAPAEDEWLDPNSHYALTKAAATHYCRYTALKHNLRLITLRLYSVYGPFEEPARLMPTLVIHGLNGGLPPLVNPNIARDYIYTADVDDACILAAERGAVGAVYNLGTGVQTSLAEVVSAAREIMAIPVEPHWGSMPDRQWDTSIWVANTARIRHELGWEPRHRFNEGLHKMVDWMRGEWRPFYETRILRTQR